MVPFGGGIYLGGYVGTLNMEYCTRFFLPIVDLSFCIPVSVCMPSLLHDSSQVSWCFPISSKTEALLVFVVPGKLLSVLGARLLLDCPVVCLGVP